MSDWKPKPALEAFRAVMACPHNQQAARAIAERDTRGIIAAGLREKQAARDEWAVTPKPPEPVAAQPPQPKPPRVNEREHGVLTLRGTYVEVCDEVARRLHTTRLDIESSLRHPRILAARMIVVSIMRMHTPASYTVLAVLIRGRKSCQATMVEAKQRACEKMDEELYPGAGETYAQCIAAWDHNGRKFRKVGT